MRTLFLSLMLLLAGDAAALAQFAPEAQQVPGFEIVKRHADIEINADGSFLDAGETAYRALNAQGLQQLQQMTLSYTQGYQSVEIAHAYTLKADGTRIDVPHGGFLFGHGASSAPGFDDIRTVTIVFPDLEVGDQIVLETLFRQLQPWFPGQVALNIDFSRTMVSHDQEVDVTAPPASPLFIDANGLDGGARDSSDGKKHWTWTFHNDAALKPEPNAVAESDDGPRLMISSFSGYDAVAHVYAGQIAGKDAVTPQIQSLADQLTTGITDRREQARVLYEWVSTHISYVAIVLGAGGFVPHSADEVLSNRYGDCKDHVMLLDALLAAKQIQSSPVLIDAGSRYRLSSAASPYVFNHLINYVPEFHLYLDSTARYAPFGVLPTADAGKPVVTVSTGEVSQTPAVSGASIDADENIKVSDDGSATGDSAVTATGAAAIDMRMMMNAIPAGSDGDYLREAMGPGTDGTIDRGDISKLTPTYSFGSHYRLTGVAEFPGPGALPPWIGYKPFYFTTLIAGALPPSRMRAYSCPSISASERVTIQLPADVTITSLPRSAHFRAGDITLTTDSQNLGHNTVREITTLQIAHAQAVCTADYYNSMRGQLTKMVAALRGQILYK